MMKPISGGIIAAGSGSRLKANAINQPKALIPIAGKPLLEWTLNQFINADIKDITIIFNGQDAPICAEYLRNRYQELNIQIISKTTQSSFE
ncbi:MAG: sugar phosphate nucleotidyltransferase, partial [Chlamydiota bacterium]|nr:sugar phosphate nucleotidyltransferase [Chlamydiota bacterium]